MYLNPSAGLQGVPPSTIATAKLRESRWRFFQIVFVFTYLGIVFDIITTAMGVSKAGSLNAYEQNPLGGGLISRLGWVGLFALMTALMLITHTSLRVAYKRVRPGWLRLVNGLMLFIGAMRWFAVVTAIMYLLQPGR